jgi:ferredoxin-NADP reductase
MTPAATLAPSSVRRRLLDAATWLTTPLLPDDYLGLLNPLWSTRELRGRVEAVQPETRDSATVVIRPGREWSGHRPGQYVGIGVDVDGVRHWRTYSLTSVPARADRCITITVKAQPGGTVSPRLVRQVSPGTVVRLAPADGDFVLPGPLPDRLLFLTAGSGITPVMGMLRSLVAAADVQDVVVVHSARTPDEVIFGDELRDLDRRFPGLRLYERHTARDGRLTAASLPAMCPDWRERAAWACGPAGMLDDLSAQWKGAGLTDRLHLERFQPVVAPIVDGKGGRVRFTVSRRDVDADGATPLLVAGEEAGALLPSGCRMGICRTCVGRLRSGQVRDLRTGEVHGAEGDLVQTCVSAAAGPVEIDL